MNHSHHILPLAVLLSIVFGGCISHHFFVDLSQDGQVRYTLEGDSLDLSDERLPQPDSLIWKFLESHREDRMDETVWFRSFQAPVQHSIPHPIAPSTETGLFSIDRQHYLLFKQVRFKAFFPDWNVTRLYGNLRQFVPPEAEVLKTDGIDTLLPASQLEDLRRSEAKGLQKGAARRYLMQMNEMVAAWYSFRGIPIDSLAAADALERFNAVLSAYLMTLREYDPLEVSLEWFQELRSTMIQAASEATGGSEVWFTNIADSLEQRWQTWRDIEDDNVTLTVILPAFRVIASPDTVKGDTLYWEFPGAQLADSAVVIQATGWTPVWWVDVLILLAILGFLISIISKQRKSR